MLVKEDWGSNLRSMVMVEFYDYCALVVESDYHREHFWGCLWHTIVVSKAM